MNISCAIYHSGGEAREGYGFWSAHCAILGGCGRATRCSILLQGVRLYGRLRVICSLCGMAFDGADPLIKERMRRHQEWHNPGLSYGRNAITGRVEWLAADGERDQN